MQRIILLIFTLGLAILNSYGQQVIHKDAKKFYKAAVVILGKKNIDPVQLNNAFSNLKKAYEIDSSYADIRLYLGVAYFYKSEYQQS
jgi:Tfp pilus assembly protein PilF